MVETITRCLCDICKSEGAKSYQMPVYRTFDSTDGRCPYDPPQVRVAKIDLCDKCVLAATNIHSVGVQCEKYEIERNNND